MKPQPCREQVVELGINRVARPTGLLMLHTCPVCLERPNSTSHQPLCPKVPERLEVCQQGLDFKAIDSLVVECNQAARITLKEVEHIISHEKLVAERMY